MPSVTRRDLIKQGTAALLLGGLSGPAFAEGISTPILNNRPRPQDRRFRSDAVENFIAEVRPRIADPVLAALFANCFPNTLDTTVQFGTFEGKPDTAVITGDIPAMWLRDSSAQVFPYLPLTKTDAHLQALFEGLIRRQARCLLIDPYANAFMADLGAPPLEWAQHDETSMKQGVGERKYELDSLCYPIRISYAYWQHTGAVQPFDTQWHEAMRLVVATMREQQRKTGPGPYRFQRFSKTTTETQDDSGYGNPVKPVGLIASAFRPSDDACMLPFLVPSNLFAVRSLHQLAEMANAILHDGALAQDASCLAAQTAQALQQHAVATTPEGTIWAYEVDGFGGQILMDDANAPSLLSLPYLDSSPNAALYQRTRAFVWSDRNPWFFRGKAGEGIGGPHVGTGMIWPMSQVMYALTSQSSAEVRMCLQMLKASTAGTGFTHESYNKDDPEQFTRPWFAWANSLAGELLASLVVSRSPALQNV